MTSLSDDSKEVYFLRLQLLLTELGTDCLRQVFDKVIPPADLHRELQNNRIKVNELKKKGRITKKQEKLLYPTTAPPSSENFDISLLITLLRNMGNLRANRNSNAIWEEDDNSKINGTDTTSDVIRIRNIRNEVEAYTMNNSLLLFSIMLRNTRMYQYV